MGETYMFHEETTKETMNDLDDFEARLNGQKPAGRKSAASHALKPVPTSIRLRFKSVNLHADIMYVNGIAFFVSISEGIKFGTAAALGNEYDDSIVAAVKAIHGTYGQRGFRVTTIQWDGQFASTHERILNELDVPLGVSERRP